MKTLRRIFLLLFFFLILTLGGIGFFLYQNYQYKSPQAAVVFIPKGTSVKKIADLLEKEKVIRNKYVFEAYVRITGLADKIKSGEYEINEKLNLLQVVDLLKSGKVKVYRFTIPEGYNIYGVCEVLAGEKLLSKDKCLQSVKDTTLLSHTDKAETLEGYLFPETYTYDKETKPMEHIPNMVKMFYKKIGEKRRQRAKEMGLSLHELVTFASVVEKETGLASERPVIAGVFHNRLKKGMLLQSDPTTIYGIIENFNGNLTRRDLETHTEYNTYTTPGLPAGPICNPGLKAIDAVLYPESTDALYFVAKGDGSHYFSSSLSEHNRAVRYFQLRRGTMPENDLHKDENKP